MKTIIATILAIHLAVISCSSAHNKCQKITIDDEESEAYSCVGATSEDSKNLPHDTKWLQYTVSKLSYLPEKAFAVFDLRGLAFYNCEIGEIHPNAFDGLGKLQQLTFYGSNIHVLKASWFKHLSSLTHLFLDQNDMVYIEPMVFPLIPNLEYLNVEDNNLNYLSTNTLEPLKNLRYLRVNENPWLCTLYWEGLVKWMDNRQIDYEWGNGPRCMWNYVTSSGPNEYETELVKTRKGASSSKSDNFSITKTGNVLLVGNNISILSQIPDNVKSITFVDSYISEIPRFAFFRFGNSLQRLEFSNSKIREIHPEAFAGLSKLKRLILFNNSIGTLRAEWFIDLPSLVHLSLDNNGIENIQSGVFPLFDRLRSLSLRKNHIGCFPLEDLSSMKNLRNMNIENNTWICKCLEDMKNWINRTGANRKYSILPAQCTDSKAHMDDRHHVTGYRNIRFEKNFEDEEAEITSENAEPAQRRTSQNPETYTDTSTAYASAENQKINVMKKEDYHKRQRKIANFEYYLLRTDKNHQNHGNVIRAKYDGFERTVMPDTPSKYINLNTQSDEFSHSITNSPAENSSVESSSFGRKKSYVFVGLTLWDLLISPTDAEAIRFEKSSIPEVMPSILSRFHNLRSLNYANCGVQEILPYAFEGLVNLQELVLDDNNIIVVRSFWFDHIPNLERLSLKRNSITRIDKGAFELLPNLKYLGISDNRLNSIEIAGLSRMKKLNRIDIGRHPCPCTCQIELHEWLMDRKVSYDDDFESEFDKIRNGTNCAEAYQSFKMAYDAYQNKNSIDIEESNINSVEENFPTIKRKQSSRGTKETQENEEVMENSNVLQINPNDTVIDMTTIEVEQTTPMATTTLRPNYSKGQCTFHQFNRLTESRWWCSGGNISILNQIPDDAERIDIVGCDVPVLPAGAFNRFSNLTKLLFYNSSIRNIKSRAFASLHKLDWLFFVNNSLPIIRSSWFDNLKNITLLGLVRNSIADIELGVFNKLPNLKQLSIQDNNLRCIYTSHLTLLKSLQNIRIHDNPWKWRCREEMTQFFESRNISYVKSETYDGKRVMSDLPIDRNFQSI